MVVLGENGWNIPSLNMKLITFNKAFEIENIIAIILRFFHQNISKLDHAKWDLNSLTWLNLKKIYKYIYIYIYLYEYGFGFFGPMKRRVNSILWKFGSGRLAVWPFFNYTRTFHFESFFVLFFDMCLLNTNLY